MRPHPHLTATRLREQRQQSYLAAPMLAQRFPRFEQLSVEMRFSDPEGKLRPSPHSRIFSPDMQAFFDFQCPLRDCEGGGFELQHAVQEAVSRRGHDGNGRAVCQGRRARKGDRAQACGLELEFQVRVRLRETAT